MAKTKSKKQSTQVPFMDLASEHRPLWQQIQKTLCSVMETSDFVLGKSLENFENAFAKYHKVQYAIGVASGTEAIHLSLRALGIGAGDEVLIPTHTFAASANAVRHSGATPVLVDIDPSSYHMDLAKAEMRLTPRTKAIIPVHLYGRPMIMKDVMAFAEHHQLAVVEDACQAHGARIENKIAGAIGATGCFSFYPSKNLGAWGDGGMITTSDPIVHERLIALRNHGQKKKYVHQGDGFNSRLDGLQAAVLQIKMKHLDKWNTLRQTHAKRYRALLKDVSFIELPSEAPNAYQSVYHLFVIRSHQRDALQAHLQKCGIGTGIHYPIPLHRMDVYAKQNPAELFPVAERICGEILSLPMYPELSVKQIDHVAQAIRSFT